ncbi:hypothetical protein ACCO45_009227 [Purpureocillium lilacinum]|uniref:Uncharacterized protein n=1 Tax=Purpureocillium lilacinum TaxID=33203 RepID=A0ACC4DLR4_PURLI|nr:hypothetical protein PLICBS_006077 [Purpureocillium lilacinum]
MSAIASAASRLSSPVVAATARRTAAAAANFSTSARALRPEAVSGAAAPSSSSWAWRNLSPKTRRYVVYGLGAGAAIDSYVIYNYFPGILGLGEDKKN